METKLAAQRIDNRFEPCACGCKGRDPHHAPSFIRTVTDIAPAGADETCVTKPLRGVRQPIGETGRARIPGYPRPVRVVRTFRATGSLCSRWEIDASDADAARNGQ